MALFVVLLTLVVLFPLSEIALAVFKRAATGSAMIEDRGTLGVFWAAIIVGLLLATAAQWVPAARLHLPVMAVRVTALALLAAGLAVRWTAIWTLGRFFTVNVAIHPDHEILDVGLYRFVRHPSYVGLLVAFLGLGFVFGNWLSICALLVLIVPAVLYRTSREERALLKAFGEAYGAYCARTKRFLPGLF